MNNEYYKGVYYDSDHQQKHQNKGERNMNNGYDNDANYDLDHQQLMDGIINVGQRVIRRVDILDRKVEAAVRKPRRALMSTQIACLCDGRIVLIKSYDDGSNEAVPFIVNYSGPWKVSQIIIEENPMEKFWGISFRDNRYQIIGNIDKVNPAELYRLFVENQVVFSPNIKTETVKKLLYEALASEIKFTEDTLILSNRSGWLFSTYITKENFGFNKERVFSDFPVMHTLLPKIEFESELCSLYLQELKQVTRTKADRLMLLAFPYVCIMSSLLEKAGKKNRICLNLIPMETLDIRSVTTWFQELHKDEDPVISVQEKKKDIEKFLLSAGDEAVILDCRTGAGATSYIKKTVAERRDAYCSIIAGERVLQGSHNAKMRCGLVLVSDNQCRRRNVYNLIILDIQFTKKLSSKAFRQMLVEFVHYVEANFEVVEKILRWNFSKTTEVLRPLKAVSKVLKGFGEYIGVDIFSELELCEEINFAEIQEALQETEVSYTEQFVNMFRRVADNFFFLPRDNATSGGYVIPFSDEFIWIKPDFMKAVLKCFKSENMLAPLLLEAKEEGNLLTDTEGLTRKLQINGKRSEFYQFKRPIFEREGCVDIIDLGKERGSNEGS